ncbi:MAG: hypothetical protein AAGA58_05705 [Verrucomicrobiota bacterium]
MNTHVEFRSHSFPAREGEEDEINPGRWGMALAEFLADGITKAGFTADVGGYEDWGVYILVENEEFPLMVGCGNYEEYDDGFLVFIDPSKPEIKKSLFRRRTINTRAVIEKLAEAIEETLQQGEDIRGLRWWTEDEA